MRSRVGRTLRNGASMLRRGSRQYHSGNQSKSHSTHNIVNSLKAAAAIGGTGFFAYSLITSNIKQSVVDESIIESSEVLPPGVMSIHTIQRVGNFTSGRTCGYRAHISNGDYYFYKETYDREDLVRELFYGSLGNYLVSDVFPEVFLVELPLAASGKSKYAFLSENVGDDEGNDDLEQWALGLNDETVTNRVSPRHFGVAMAFAMLTGQSDCKLANLAVIRDLKRTREGTCYTIDFESCANLPALFLTNPEEAISFIGEFRDKTMTELMMEQNADGLLDTEHDIHKPVRDKYELKKQIKPILEDAVERDLNDGSVIAFYRRFAAMTDQDFTNLFDRFGPFFSDRERKTLLKDMHYRQGKAQAYLQQHDLLSSTLNEEKHEEKFSVRNMM